MLSDTFNIIRLSEINSTNEYASALLSCNSISGPTVIITEHQTAGRGQGQNSWQSDAGKNLLFSIVLFPENIKAEEQFYLSKVTSLSVRDTVSEFTSGPVIKWPNDILAGRGKISGILIENSIGEEFIKNSIAGIGININQTEFSFPGNPTSLKLLTGNELSPDIVFEKFLSVFEYWFNLLEEKDFSQIDREYFKHLFGFQKKNKFILAGKPLEAVMSEIQKDGQMVLVMENNEKRKFGFREIEFDI